MNGRADLDDVVILLSASAAGYFGRVAMPHPVGDIIAGVVCVFALLMFATGIYETWNQ